MPATACRGLSCLLCLALTGARTTPGWRFRPESRRSISMWTAATSSPTRIDKASRCSCRSLKRGNSREVRAWAAQRCVARASLRVSQTAAPSLTARTRARASAHTPATPNHPATTTRCGRIHVLRPRRAHDMPPQHTIRSPLPHASGGTAFWSERDAGSQRSRAEAGGAPTLVLVPPAGSALVFGGTVTHAGIPVITGRRLVFVASFSPKTGDLTPLARRRRGEPGWAELERGQ